MRPTKEDQGDTGEVVVTDEMIDAGLRDYDIGGPDFLLVKGVYIAMERARRAQAQSPGRSRG